MLVDEKDVVLEASIQVGLKAQVHNHGVVVAVDVRIHTVQPLEDLA